MKIKIISKKFRGGKYYNKKVIVQDLISKYKFSVLNENHELIENLTEKDVETTIPKIGEPVLVILGKYKG